ncbi:MULTISPECIES: c-type cytochrome [unclassified Aureimonas]|uniref:c-type cytochrome n=1 Tax=unclassified Aureimonas TaxID=2615206 RepID=UPI0009EC2817|nr:MULTISPECIES: cytochrome c [unclassified Aureimonas]
MTRSVLALAGLLAVSLSTLALAQSAGTPATIVPAAPAAAPAPAAPAAAPAPAPAAPAAAAPAPAAPAAAAAPAPAAPAAAAAAAPAAGGHKSADTAASGADPVPGEGGKFVDGAGNPVYAKNADGTFDYYTWRGYKKFMANCMQCHGPDGMGSSFAPNLTDSLTRINYYDFSGIIVNGQQNKWHPVNSIMPAWGEDLNVMCFLDGIYVYLRGRADGVVPRGEPKKPAANKEAQAAENACLGF